MTPAELYAVHFSNPEPKFYTRIPNIIDHLTYEEVDEKTGKKILKKLSPYDIQLYRIIRNIAGEEGACWRNRDQLAELCNMSAGQITKSKNILQKKFNQLGGKSLIRIDKCKKTTATYGTTYHRVFIEDIWKYNNAYMATLKYQVNPLMEVVDEAPSPYDGAEQAPSPHDGAQEGALSPGDINNNPNKKISLYIEQTPEPDGSSVCAVVSSNADIVSVCEKNLELNELKTKAFNWLKKEGYDTQAAMFIALQYDSEEIQKSVLYVNRIAEIKRRKHQPLINKLGYLRKTLEQKWWKDNKFQ